MRPPVTGASQQWSFAAEPASVRMVRAEVTGFARDHGVAEETLGAVALAVSEAATNAILHGYLGLAPGLINVEAHTTEGELVVIIGDEGRGMAPRTDSPGLGLGLPTIGQIASSVDIRTPASGTGTEICMTFLAPGVHGTVSAGDRELLLAEVELLAAGGAWPGEGVDGLADLLVPAVADACAIDLLVGETAERLGLRGEPAMITTDELVAAAGGPPVVREAGAGWSCVLPMSDGERVLGLLHIARQDGPRPDAEELGFLEEIASRAAHGLAVAQLMAGLQRTRRRFEQILGALAEAVTVADAHGKLVYANSAAARLLGVDSPEELLAAAPGELARRYVGFKEDGSRVTVDDLPGRRVLAGRDAPALLSRTVRPDTGEERWLLTKATRLDDEPLAVNIVEDVTEAKNAELRHRFLARAGEVLVSSLDFERTLASVAELVVPELADWCAIDLLDEDGQLQRVALAHVDPELRELGEEIHRRWPTDVEAPGGVGDVLRTGEPVLIPELTDEMLEAGLEDPEHLAAIRRIGLRSVVLLPMVAGDRVGGVLTLVNGASSRVFGADDLSFGLDVARRAAMAVENARLFRERDDEQLRRDERRYRSLVHATSLMVWVAHTDGRLISDMPAWREITGQSVDELLGHGWLDGVHPDDRPRVGAAWEHAISTNTVYEVSYRMLAAVGDDRHVDVRGAPVIEADGSVTEWIGTVVDVTERRVAEEAQRELESALGAERAILEKIVADAPTGLCLLWGPDHRYRLFNDKYLEIVPAGRVEMGRPLIEAVPEAHAAIPLLDRARRGEQIELHDYEVAYEDAGGSRFYRLTFTPVRDDGDDGGVLVVAVEVTEEVHAREDLGRRLAREREVAESLQRALLPESLPEIAGLDIAAHYLPGTLEVGVGGDWYDVVEIDDQCALLVIGDVCGRGLSAATVMGQMRAALRAYAVEDPSPATILTRLGRYATRLPMTDMVTVGIGLLDLGSGSLRYASAGHLPPVLCTATGTAALMEVDTGAPIGVDAQEYREVTVELGTGDALLLYTDGLVEDRQRPLDSSLAGLVEAVECGSASAVALGEAVLAAMLDERPLDDDAALLACRLVGPAAP